MYKVHELELDELQRITARSRQQGRGVNYFKPQAQIHSSVHCGYFAGTFHEILGGGVTIIADSPTMGLLREPFPTDAQDLACLSDYSLDDVYAPLTFRDWHLPPASVPTSNHRVHTVPLRQAKTHLTKL